MSETKRKRKKNKKKRIIGICLISGLFTLLIIAAWLTYSKIARRPLYISPLAKNFSVSTVSSNDKNLSLLKTNLSKIHIDYENITSSNEAYLVKLKDKSQIIFSSQKNIGPQISSLQFILTRLTMEGKGFNELDFRFDKPVIRLK